MVVSDHYNTFKHYLSLWYTVLLLCGEENHRFCIATRCVAGKKIKGRGGGIKSKAAQLYTPLFFTLGNNEESGKKIFQLEHDIISVYLHTWSTFLQMKPLFLKCMNEWIKRTKECSCVEKQWIFEFARLFWLPSVSGKDAYNKPKTGKKSGTVGQGAKLQYTKATFQ